MRGEVSFHHSMTWHGSPFIEIHQTWFTPLPYWHWSQSCKSTYVKVNNQSPRPRRAIAIHYMTGAARFDQSGEHLMKQFVDLPDNAPMAEAGPHFPVVCRNGEPVGVPARLRVMG